MPQIDQLFDQIKAFERPPVENWHPDKTVDFDLRIAANGDWIHEGGLIKRHKLVKLFSTVLAYRDENYYLVTPPVRYKIRVDEVPFQAVEMRVEGQGAEQEIYFRTNMDEVVKADAAHRLYIVNSAADEEPSPYIEIRDGLIAKLTRPVFYELAELCVLQDDSPGVYSAGIRFPLA